MYTLSYTSLRLMLIVCIVSPCYSEWIDLDIPQIKSEITLSKENIISGEPLALRFTFTNISDGEAAISLEDSYNIFDPDINNRQDTEYLKISLTDDNGCILPRRELLCRPKTQSLVFSFLLKPGETIIHEYPLHLRMSTRLKYGQFYINLKSFNLYLCYNGSSETVDTVGPRVRVFNKTLETFIGPTLKFNVRSCNMNELTSVYAALMEEVNDALNQPFHSWVGKDYLDIQTPIRTMLWAEGPAAVHWQIELIYDTEKDRFRFWPPAIVNTWDNIVRYSTPEQIERVLEMARHPECLKEPGKNFSKHYTPGLAWAIHQWHANGSEEIKERTRELAEKLPDEDPCPQSMELGQYPYGKP